MSEIEHLKHELENNFNYSDTSKYFDDYEFCKFCKWHKTYDRQHETYTEIIKNFDNYGCCQYMSQCEYMNRVYKYYMYFNKIHYEHKENTAPKCNLCDRYVEVKNYDCGHKFCNNCQHIMAKKRSETTGFIHSLEFNCSVCNKLFEY